MHVKETFIWCDRFALYWCIQLHWLPIQECAKFIVACLVCQSLFGQAPLYLADDCCLVSGDSGELTFRLTWCREHSAVTATELLQPLDLACWTLFQSSCTVQTSPTDCLDDSWRDTFFGKREHGALWLLICGVLERHLLTYGTLEVLQQCTL